MVGTPVPEAGNTDSGILKGHLFAFSARNASCEARVRRELGKATHIVEVGHVTRHEEQVEEVKGRGVVLLARVRTFATAVSLLAARLLGEEVIDGLHISLGFGAFDRRSCKTETTGERRRSKPALLRKFGFAIDIITGVHATARVGSRDEPVGNLFVELLGFGVAEPVVGPGHAPRSTGGIVKEAGRFGLLHRGARLGRLVAVPVTPVRNKARRRIAASSQIRVSRRGDAGGPAAIYLFEHLEVCRRRVARVERIVPLVTRLDVIATDVIRGHPANKRLGIVQVGSAPLLGSHHKSEGCIEVSVGGRTRAATTTDTPVHTGAITAIGLPCAIEFVKYLLVIHVHGNQHTVGNGFGNRRASSFRSENPTLACIVPGFFPLTIVVLDHVRICKRNRVAVGALHVLRERVRSRHRRRRSQSGHAHCCFNEVFHLHPHFFGFPTRI